MQNRLRWGQEEDHVSQQLHSGELNETQNHEKLSKKGDLGAGNHPDDE